MLGNDRYDDIDRYMIDAMTPEEREAFVRDVESDASLRAHLHMVEDIRDSLGRRADKLSRMTEWKAENHRKKKRVMQWTGVSIAAAVMLGVFISYPTSYAGLQDRRFEKELSSVIRRGDNIGRDILSCWESEEYDRCLVLIHEELGEYETELDGLRDLPEDEASAKAKEYQLSMDNLAWANIQTLLKMKQYESALIAVEEYIATDGIYKDKAVVLYKKLKKKLGE